MQREKKNNLTQRREDVKKEFVTVSFFQKAGISREFPMYLHSTANGRYGSSSISLCGRARHLMALTE